MPDYLYGGVYDRWGYTQRNGLLKALPLNPLEPNAKTMETGNAGLDGYSVLSRADRTHGERTIAHTEPFFEAPKNSEDMS